VSVWAVSTTSISSCNSVTSQHIYLMSNYLKMTWIRTASVPTSMVWLQSFWNLFSMMILPRKSMDIDIANLPIDLSHKHNSITFSGFGSHPIPATCVRINVNFFKEAFNYRTESWWHVKSIS
jgi:hypothetical protein